MTITPIVVCRMDCPRLPGKPLRFVEGKPLLWYIAMRCGQVEAFEGRFVVATSDRPVDDPVANYCRKEGLTVFRGAADNVAGRVLACARHHGAEWFAPLGADSPFVEPQLIEKACRAARTAKFDLVTNLFPRSFPEGVAVELVRTEAFADAYLQMNRPGHFQHTMQYVYENIARFRYFNIERDGGNLSHLRLAIDTPEDLDAFRRLAWRIGDRWTEASYLEAIGEYAGRRRAA